MDLFDVLSMLGGLALFLYGMHSLGDGLEKLSGGKLETILEKLTSKPIFAVLLGAGVTAAIQSSSATTVMVVGFVNSGIMKLHQAVYIIMGANIGTTVTSWILSLTGVEGDNFIMQLLKPESFSPIFAFIGIIFLMFTKSEKKKVVGSILIGFAILMTGMGAMSAAVKPLAEVPEFTNILTVFKNPIFGMIAGAILTAVIQSSSASVGILQALCATGVLSFSAALPIIMGQNIGTCVTAIISSIGTGKNARRTALVHLYFNIIGTVLFMILFYLLNAFIHFSFMDSQASEVSIAVVHSVFNILTVLVLFPFAGLLEKLACLTVKDNPENSVKKTQMEKDFRALDTRFLDVPGLAIAHSKSVAENMSELSKECLFKAMSLLTGYDEDLALEVSDLEDKVDKYEDELGTYLVKLSSKNLNENDSRMLSELLHCIGDFERISDHAINIQEAAKEMHDKELKFSEKAKTELSVFGQAVQDIVNLSFKVFKDNDDILATAVEPLEEAIDTLNYEIKNRHVRRLREGKCTIELGFVLSDVLVNYERISDHCSNIAVSLIQIHEDNYETHGYLDALKHKDEKNFKEKYNECLEHYILP
ncbi:MAG: Na/Pi cotransporter family protein [Lachnospiraceae bacterium]